MAWLTELRKPLHHDKTVIHEGTSDNYYIPISTRKHVYFLVHIYSICIYIHIFVYMYKYTLFPVPIFVLIFSYLYPNQALPSDLKLAHNRSVLRTNNFEIMANRDRVW